MRHEGKRHSISRHHPSATSHPRISRHFFRLLCAWKKNKLDSRRWSHNIIIITSSALFPTTVDEGPYTNKNNNSEKSRSMAIHLWKLAAFHAALFASSSSMVSVMGFSTATSATSRTPLLPQLRMADVAVADAVEAGNVFNPENIR